MILTVFSLHSSCKKKESAVEQNNDQTKIISAEDLQINLNESKGHLIILHYWATWCKSCLPEIQSLGAMQKEFKNRGLRIIGVSIDNPQDRIKLTLVKDTYTNSGNLYGQFVSGDDTRKIMTIVDKDWLEIVPVSYLIDQDGSVIKRFAGSRSFSDLQNRVNSIYRN